MKKLINFDDDVVDKVQKYADKYCKGNFTMALHILIRKVKS